MTMTMQEYANSVLVSLLGVIAFLSCITVGVCSYRLWSMRGFYSKDFLKLSRDADLLNKMTLRIQKDIDTARRSVKIPAADLELLDQAEQWDTGIRIALATWQDIMEPRKEVDVEAQRGNRREKRSWRRHGRYVIEVMRSKVMEGLEKRKELTYPLHKIHLGLASRDSSISKSKQALVEVTEIAVHERNTSTEKYESDSGGKPERIADTSLEMLMPCAEVDIAR